MTLGKSLNFSEPPFLLLSNESREELDTDPFLVLSTDSLPPAAGSTRASCRQLLMHLLAVDCL